MRISAVFLPGFALIAGFAGFLVRQTERLNVFDHATGLPQRGASVTWALIILTAVFLVIILLFSIMIRMKRTSPGGFENAFGTDVLAYPLMFVLFGIAWLGAAVKSYFDASALGSVNATTVIFIVLSVLSAVSVALFAVEVYQGSRRTARYVLSVVPTLFMCYWLILLYRRNAANPILLDYCYHCLALIASTLGFYFTSGFAYNRPAPSKAVFSFLAAIFFCFVTLADSHTIGIRIMLAVLILINTVYSSMLLRNLKQSAGSQAAGESGEG